MNEDSFQVKVDQLIPNIAIQNPDTLSCFKTQIQLNASASSTGANFLYRWSTSNGLINGLSDSLLISVSKAGNYELEITNIGNYCTNKEGISILEKTKPIADFISKTDNLEIELFNTSSGLPDQFYWDFGDGHHSFEPNPKHRYENYGEYNICLQVENECGNNTICTPVFIFKPGILSIASSELKHVGCYGEATGSIQIITEGGQPPYRYLWNNQDTTSTIKHLTAGNYLVNITDQLNNTIAQEFTILQPDEIILDQAEISPASAGLNNGKIKLFNSGGIQPYQYNWSNGMSSNPIELISAGTYYVELTDANLCVKEFGPLLLKK